MITFLINLSKEKITESTMKIYLYPYLKEHKLRIIDKNKMDYEDIVNEIKYYIHNNNSVKFVKKEYQILIVLPIYDENSKYFEKNLTNSIYEITEKFYERLLDEKIEPVQVNYLVLDSLERDFMKKAIDINSSISEELNVDGYISSPILTHEDILELSKLCKTILNKNIEKNEKIHDLDDELTTFFKNKKEDILKTDIGKIKDSALNEHPKKYRSVYKELKRILEYEINRGNIEKLDLQKTLIEILKNNNYYYDFIFNNNDLRKLQFIWERNNIVMKEEESFNLSDEFINKIINVKKELFQEIENMISSKKEALQLVSKDGNFQNCYLKEKTLEEIRKTFIGEYLEDYLNEIINTKTIKTKKIYTPVEKMKFLLRKYYSLQKIQVLERNSNIYRIPFIVKNTLKYNENLIKFIYFTMFLIEYGEQKETYMDLGSIFSLENVSYRKEYLEGLFDKYKFVLKKEEKNIDSKQQNLKLNAKIDYYNPQVGSYNKSNKENQITEKELPKYSIFFEEDDFKNYKRDWLDDLEKRFDDYIEEANEALFDYKAAKNKFNLHKLEKEIDKNIKDEVRECQETLDKANRELRKIEEKIKIDVKNEWKDKNKQEISLSELEGLLKIRPIKSDIVTLSIILILYFLFCTTFQKTDLVSQIFIYGAPVILVIVLFLSIVFVLNGQHMGKIKQILNTSKRIRDSYVSELRETFNLKKEHIDKQILYRIAEKNLLLAKKEEKRIQEKIELLGCYSEILENHCQMVDTIRHTLNGINNNRVDEEEYRNETFSNKLEELDSKKAPFENDIFNLVNYIEIDEYKKFNVLYNDQENLFIPKNIFGCENIKIVEDEIYKKVGREW